MPTGFTLNGLNLRTLAHSIGSINGWDTFPGFRGRGVEYAFQHGEDISGRRFYQARDIDIVLGILDTEANGAVTTTRERHAQDNVDALMGALHNSTGTIDLVRTLPGGAVRTAKVRPMSAIPIRDWNGVVRIVNLTLRMPYPFWSGAAAVVSGSGPLTPNNLGNAPVNNMIVTFTTPGRITDPAGWYLESSAAGAVVNVGTGAITGAAKAAISSNSPWWLQLEPGVTSLAVTGGDKQIDWNHGHF